MRRIINLVAASALLALSAALQAQPIDLFGGATFPASLALAVANEGSTSLDEPPSYGAIFRFLDSLNNPPQGFPGILDPTPNVSAYTGGPVEAGDYLFLLYGTPGSAAAPPTGDVAVIYFPTAESGYSFPSTDEDVPLTLALLFDHVPSAAPDGGLTLSLLGAAFGGLAFTRRVIGKN
jgi:hypothetical protein